MTINDVEIKVMLDEFAENPRAYCGKLGVIIYHSNRYILGDKDISPDEFEMPEDAIYLPVYAMIHGTISLSVADYGDKYDSGQSGYIYTTPERIREWYGDNPVSEDEVKAMLEDEVKEFSAWLSGECYGYKILDKRTGEELDSCWGFYGYDYCREYACGAAQAIVDNANAAQYDSAVGDYLYARAAYENKIKDIA